MPLLRVLRLCAVVVAGLCCVSGRAQTTLTAKLVGAPPLDSAELTLPQLIDDVQARNPSLAAMTAAWQAAAQRYPQTIALEDPTLMAMGAPASVSSDQVESAYAIQLNQKLPWFGKRAARGRQAQAETSEAYHDFEDSRICLAEMTEAAFFDYYLVNHHVQLPPYLPWPLRLVWIIGGFEIAGGIGLLVRLSRYWAGIGLVALLIAVYPANIYMAMYEVPFGSLRVPRWGHLVRLPLQFVLIALVIWVANLWPSKAARS